MSGFAWLFIGAAVGAVDGALLWHAVQGLRPGASESSSLVRVLGTGLLRNLGVALVLLLALQRGLSAGLWALLGLAIARIVWLRRLAS